jgi:hypothetical protein
MDNGLQQNTGAAVNSTWGSGAVLSAPAGDNPSSSLSVTVEGSVSDEGSSGGARPQPLAASRKATIDNKPRRA